MHKHYCDKIGYFDEKGNEVKGNPFSDNWIRKWTGWIEDLEKEIQDTKTMTNDKILSVLEEWKGRDIDIYKITVKKFYNDIDYYSVKAKEQARKAA